MEPEHRGREVWYSKLFRIFNSAICFSIAYIAITQLYWVSMALVAKLFKFDSFIYYYGIKFMLNDQSWNHRNISLIYGTGPVFALMAGLLCLLFFYKLKRIPSLLNVLFLWGFVIGTGIFSTQALIASLGMNNYDSDFYQNLAVVFTWLKIPAFLVYLLNIPFAFMLIYFAANSGKPFLSLSFSYGKVNKLSRKRRYFFETVIVPFLLGGLITTVLTFPMNLSIHLLYLAVIAVQLLIAWYMLVHIEVLKEDVLRLKSLQVLNPFLVFFLVLAIITVLVTWKGLYFSFN